MHNFPRCFVLSLSLITIWGCETKRIGYRDSPDHYEALKRIECEILHSSPNKATTHDGLMTIPDHFGFRQALKAYEGNFFNTCYSSIPDISCLSGSCVTGLVRQALMDGILDRNPDSIAVVIDRDEKRRRLQSEFWRDNYGLTNGVALPYGFPVKTNAYARLSASYEYGYRNARSVVSKLNRSPIPAGYYCAPRNWVRIPSVELMFTGGMLAVMIFLICILNYVRDRFKQVWIQDCSTEIGLQNSVGKKHCQLNVVDRQLKGDASPLWWSKGVRN